jgi:hypothetical protein
MAITLEYLSYSGAKDNPGGGCRAVFDFQGPDGGALYVGYTFQIGFDYEPKSAVLANNVVVEGLTGVITEVAHETASYATGKLEIYALQYGTTYNINTFDTSGTPMSDITFTPQSNNSIRAKNLVSGTLADDITTSTTNILVHIADNISAQGITDFFPTAPFYITIMPKTPTIGVANRLDSEIIKITNVDHDQVGNAALTGVRAQRDTTAKAFSTGDIVTVGVYAEDAVFLSEDGTTETESPWVNTNDIVDGSITSEKIANGAVTSDKIDSTTLYQDITNEFTWAETNPLTKQALLIHGKIVVIIYFGANVTHSPGQRIADIPAEYRPANQYWFPAGYGLSSGNVTVGTNGQFNCNAVGDQSANRVSTICIYTTN